MILDSSVIIAAERKGLSVRQFLEQVFACQGNVETGVSVAELMHGAYPDRGSPLVRWTKSMTCNVRAQAKMGHEGRPSLVVKVGQARER
jgi:hypothetical protein